MRGTCITAPLHTLDMIERPFYIPRTHAQSYSPTRFAGNRPSVEGRRSLPLMFSAPVRAFFPRSASDHPLQQEVLAKQGL